MKVTKLNCTACGAPISVPEDLDFINCASCGSFLGIERGEGYVALKVAEKLAKAIESSGRGTQDVIRENTAVTRSELQRLQAAQEISAAQMHLTNIQAEIRAIQRLPLTGTTAGQISGLRASEYEALDRIRLLNNQVKAPDENDAAGHIKFAESEMQWIAAEIAALNQSNHPQRGQLVQSLNERKAKLAKKAHTLKVQQIKDKLPSFKQGNLTFSNQAQAEKFFQQLEADIKSIEPIRWSDEGKEVYEELQKRRQIMKLAIIQMERERISGTLSTNGYQADASSIASLNEYLIRIDQDIAGLSSQSNNTVANEYRGKLLDEKKRVQKQIQKLEKQAAKPVKPAGVSGGAAISGILAVLASGFVAFFAGIPELFQSLFVSRANQASIETKQESVIDELSSKDDLISGTYPAAGSNTQSVGMGCFLGLLLMSVITVVGMMILVTAFPDTNDTGGATVGGIFLSMALGVGAGAWVFLRFAAPNTTIGGFRGMPKINITPGKPRNGLNSPLAVKSLVGITICLLVWMLFLSLAGYATTPESSSAGMIVIIGVLLGPVVAAFVAALTDFPKDQAA